MVLWDWAPTMVLWDWAPIMGLSKDEQAEEIQVSSVNVTTRSKGPVVDQSLVFPKKRRAKETMKKIIGTTQTKHKVNLLNITEISPLITKYVKTLANKPEISKKKMEEFNMGYDIVKDIKKTKVNISVFELCNLPQQRKKLLEEFDPQSSSTS